MRLLLLLCASAWQVAQCVSKIATAAEYRVNLEKYGATDEMYAGLMPLTWEEGENTEGSLFFWLAKKRAVSSGKVKTGQWEDGREKLVVWLNGGPGCSSLLGMVLENGPFNLKEGPAFHRKDGGDQAGDKKEKGAMDVGSKVEGAKDMGQYVRNETEWEKKYADKWKPDDKEGGDLKYTLEFNPYSWNEVANVLYVEQPLRTGFAAAASGSPAIRDEVQFLLSFLQVFKQYEHVELYITGESYAGFYIPWMAQHIVEEQMQGGRRDTSDGINLQGVAIGNGVMDMFQQEPSYAEYAYSHGLIPRGAYELFSRQWQDCVETIERLGLPLTRPAQRVQHGHLHLLRRAALRGRGGGRLLPGS
ncbi:Alpha/Beta hydrolase protein [Ochromonadaceae sp. CCMP2298]|nr:Alpha/Beta hydrolase protein [Ochromonadaceae sp. CCMP2298]